MLPGHLRFAPNLLAGFDPLMLARAQSRIPPIPSIPPIMDPMVAQYGYAQLLHGNGSRKNATRESTAPLKSWLAEHPKNPYPTKGEKIMLALVSGTSLFFIIGNS